MSSKNVQEIALKTIKRRRKPIDFGTLWDIVSSELQLSEAEKKSRMMRFYNTLMMDANLIQLEKNHWDLKSRHSYDAIKLDLSKFDDGDDKDEDAIDSINDRSYAGFEVDYDNDTY